MKFNTKTIHAGQSPDPTTGAIMTPVFQTSTYIQASPGDHKGYEYARTQNPTRDALQRNLAELENGKHGICFASGMAATDTLIKLLKPGDEVIATNDLYGGTYRIFRTVYEKYGVKAHFVPMNDLSEAEKLINPNTKMIWVETPTNPMLNVIDIEKFAALAKTHGVLLCVDNTFCSPYLQTPLDLGADIVVHSATKYLGGHSDAVHGVIVVNDDQLAEDIYFLQNTCGAVPAPWDCFLVLRGIKTLHLRMERHSDNGKAIAQFLTEHPKVGEVYYPGLHDSPHYAVASRQMNGYGGMVSFSLKDDSMAAALKVLENTNYFLLAESLGGVESLIGHPATMTHAAIPIEERRKTGVVDSLIRLSVGIEDIDDLLTDISQALDH